jgi:type III restriction enzyme
VDDDEALTEQYYDDVKSGTVKLPAELAGYETEIIHILDNIYSPQTMMPENARGNNVELKLDEDKLNHKEFKALWSRINSKSAYVVDFDTDELIAKSIDALDRELRVSQIFFKVELGEMKSIKSKEELQNAESFTKDKSSTTMAHVSANSNVKYDLVGKMVAETGLTRSAIVKILKGINSTTFENFKHNPEEFIIKASNIINEQKATVIIEHITYNKLKDSYSTAIFTEPTIKGKLGINAMETSKNLYDYLVYDSTNERKFAEQLDKSEEVAVYVKLPSGFYITTPVGKYNPDWAIAFYEGAVKHIYFVAETKGNLSTMELRKVESLKIECAREHFKKISSDTVKYDVVDGYKALMDAVMK